MMGEEIKMTMRRVLPSCLRKMRQFKTALTSFEDLIRTKFLRPTVNGRIAQLEQIERKTCFIKLASGITTISRKGRIV